MTQSHSLNLIGRREFVNFPLLNIKQVVAKIDTGAYTCAIHCMHIEVEIIEIPNPLITRVNESYPLYRLKLGFETLLNPTIAPSFSAIFIFMSFGAFAIILKDLIYPSSFRTLQIAALILLAGNSTFSCPALFPFLITVSMFEIGSVIINVPLYSHSQITS